MITSSHRAILFVLAVSNLSICGAQAFDQTSVYEALFTEEERLGLDRTYYLRGEKTIPQFMLDMSERYQIDVAPGFQFPTEPGRHKVEDFGRVRVLLVEASFLAGLWDQGCREGWATFHQRYPEAGDLAQVSQVAFNAQGDEAAVFIMLGRDCQSSWFGTFHLQRQDGQWVVAGRLNGGAA
jgi:hypothetical protein